MNGVKLIERVREFPCLWMVSARGYRDQRAKENAWKKIAGDVSTRPFPIMLIFAFFFYASFLVKMHFSAWGRHHLKTQAEKLGPATIRPLLIEIAQKEIMKLMKIVLNNVCLP